MNPKEVKRRSCEYKACAVQDLAEKKQKKNLIAVNYRAKSRECDKLRLQENLI